MNKNRMPHDRNTSSPAKKVLFSALAALIIGCIGYFSIPRGPLAYYLFAHLGALGLVGLIGGLAGVLAHAKGRAFWTAFAWGTALPIALGAVAVVMDKGMTCGGTVVLAAAILVAIVYAFLGKRSLPAAS
jgi:hypothetical protein